METLLKQTAFLNYSNPIIQKLIKDKNWQNMNEKDKIFGIYNYVRDGVAFGYNVSDNVNAARVLQDGYGQCNTKGTLFMALLRAVGVPCRIHGFYVDKIMQKGAMKGFYYSKAPKDILHSWVEVFYNGKWLNIEGFILDLKYLSELQLKFNNCEGAFCGYGVAIKDFKDPPVDWNENDTYIQADSITQDLGIYDSPDELFSAYKQKIGWFKEFVFRYIVRHLMNNNVEKIRMAK